MKAIVAKADGVHHVRSRPHQLLYDVGFLALGALLVGAGAALGRVRTSFEQQKQFER